MKCPCGRRQNIKMRSRRIVVIVESRGVNKDFRVKELIGVVMAVALAIRIILVSIDLASASTGCDTAC